MDLALRNSILLGLFLPMVALAADESAFDAQQVARAILDDSTAGDKREQLVADSVPHAAKTIAAMVKDLPDDQAEEYRRIPWIWRVAIAAGRENETKVLVELLNVSLPHDDQPLQDWQSVVLGGGIINGVSQAGVKPRERMHELLGDDAAPEKIEARWERTIQLAAEMAEDADTPTGTRYDALRILGAADWKSHGELITKYLAADAHEELQMGAVSAAGDMVEDDAAKALIQHLRGLTDHNRSMAIDALLRGNHGKRVSAGIRSGEIKAEWLNDEQKKRLEQDE